MTKNFILASLFVATSVFAQKNIPNNWHLLSPQTDKVYGMSVEQAYKQLQGKTPKTVIVAVIDSGVEIDHEDLKDNIWTNPNEIPDNGIDDDKNGYVDDVHGWSFLGGKTEDINYESLELARLYHKLHKKYASLSSVDISQENKKEYDEYKKIRQAYQDDESEQEMQLKSLNTIGDLIKNVKQQNNGKFTKAGLKSYKAQSAMEKQMQKRLTLLFAFGMNASELEDQITQSLTSIENTRKFNTMNSDSMRMAVVGDNPNDLTERYYGCNRVEGPDAQHGTHVAGIIAATRGNNKGMDGVANNVKIMPVRAVPNGDERDKDIANAIYYAVNNGATVINMSFGKYYSPDKKLVDDAVKYAASKDVVLVHAAGNESKDSDAELSFPNREMYTGGISNNWIQVGASAAKSGKNIIAPFSNYGSSRVDLFAPGHFIYSSSTDNKYEKLSGTSMAAPAVAGVAALIRGYFPELKANEVRDILMQSVTVYKKKVKVPGTKKDKRKVNELCISGGFINVNKAVSQLLNSTAK